MKLASALFVLQLVIILCMAFYAPYEKANFVLTPSPEPTISPLSTPIHCLYFPIASE